VERPKKRGRGEQGHRRKKKKTGTCERNQQLVFCSGLFSPKEITVSSRGEEENLGVKAGETRMGNFHQGKGIVY